MSFGAKPDGSGGIFWGSPGLNYEAGRGTILADMPPCSPDSHYGFDGDPVRKGTRTAIVGLLDGITGYVHGPSGGPAYKDWPNAQSLIHQQMHITAIRRAYDGGLRLMVASVADSQMLAKLWSTIGFNVGGNAIPVFDRNADYECAKRQLDYINRMAAANSSWMQVVTTAGEARQAITANKLAIILSLEMDSLTADQILDLVRTHKVRHVIPIHLINNSFGGTAVYNDAFNASNNWVNGSFFKVTTDNKLKFRLGYPQVLGHGPVGAIQPVDIPVPQYLTLGYIAPANGGHKNTAGLHEAEFQKLMNAGLLLDCAHMSQASTEQALVMAERRKYPLMNSHTGLRAADETAFSERDLMRSHAKRLASLGGVLGIGTEGSSSDRELLRLDGSPIVRFTGSTHDWSRAINGNVDAGKMIYVLRLTIKTGGDDLRGGGSDNADVILTLRDGRKLSFPNINKSVNWGNGYRVTLVLPIPRGIKMGDITNFTLSTHFGGGLFGDNWNVDEVRLTATELYMDTIRQWLTQYGDVLSVMGGHGVALGTDMNGFAPQIPFAADPVVYPITIASRTGAPAGRGPSLPRSQVGAKSYDFHTDGLAHYGMLPDFAQAVSQKSGSGPAVQALFHSAEDVVHMWELVEQAAGHH